MKLLLKEKNETTCINYVEELIYIGSAENNNTCSSRGLVY